jgi:8-oxo-dGTP pyrophosphatase MutT (NUDIX family)
VTGSKAGPRPTVRAAGGLVRRAAPTRRRFRRADPEVVLIHRPRYDDWSFPKGKLDDGEDDEAAALREVHEETGLRCRVLAALGDTEYEDRRGRPKVVRYFLMEAEDPFDEDRFVPNPEVDEIRWLSPAAAARLLTYQHDRALLHRLPRRGRRRP